jgi:hypothetical protein
METIMTMTPIMKMLATQISKSPDSLSALSRKTGVSYSTINRWKDKNHPVSAPNLDNVKRVANHFGYDVVQKKTGKGYRAIKRAA